jgi:GWxTD domain-containing protein
MNGKRINSTILIIGIYLCGVFAAKAQESAVSFNKAGISVVFRILASSPDSSEQSFGGVYFTSQEETEKTSRVHRVLADRAKGSYFGYDLVIEPATAPGKFKVSIKPLSIKPPDTMGLNDLAAATLPKYPQDLEVADGDSIALDVLTNARTKVNIVDYIKISSKRSQGSEEVPIASSETAPSGSTKAARGQATRDFTTNDIKLRLTAPTLFANGAVGPILGSEWEGMIEGTFLNMYIPGRGRFFFSLFPQNDLQFKKTGSIEGNKIRFQTGDSTYELVSEAPIVSGGGNWNIWLLHDSDYRPDLIFSVDAAGFIQYGASNDVESVLKQEWRKARLRILQPQKDTQAVYQRWFDEVRYLITDEENQAFTGLKNNEEREQFITAFWKRRDSNPNTERNEFREEFYSRLAHANQNFGYENTPGYMTDRGKIYITRGAPAEVQKTTSGEVWIYGDRQRYEFAVGARQGEFRLRK